MEGEKKANVIKSIGKKMKKIGNVCMIMLYLVLLAVERASERSSVHAYSRQSYVVVV